MTKPSPSRTYNPLHFEDLEPHRFEDMVRQLIYDFREWSDIQAVGRSGADKGVDIRAIERVATTAIIDPDENEEEYQESRLDGERREWIFQCKRYSQITPKKLVSIINEDLSQQKQPPHAYVVVAACNFSSAAREEFRREMVERQIAEFYLWGKAELEDRLYQPKYDHLLFAYFGISIQARKRSHRTELRSNLTLKKKLVRVLGDIRGGHFQQVLIRDPSDMRYPIIDSVPNKPEQLHWNYWNFRFHTANDGLIFEVERAHAYVNWETEEWDYIEDSLEHSGAYRYLFPFANQGWQQTEKWQSKKNFWGYWENNVPKPHKARFVRFGKIPYDRIILVDEVGDSLNEAPHILIDYLPGKNLVERTFSTRLFDALESTDSFMNQQLDAESNKRTRYFPEEVEEEEYRPPEDHRKS